jgi:predicted nuclease with TOPRIM domain
MEALLEKEGTVESWNDERLDELAGRVDAGFNEMREGFARIDAKFDRVDQRFDRVDERFERVDERFDRVDERFERVDERFAAIDQRFGGLATREDFQNLEARLFKALLTLLVIFGGVISTLIAINAG